MADLNGYFQLHIDDKGTFLIVHAPQGAGRPVTMLEVENYLKKKKLPYSGTLLRNAINSNSEEPIKLQQTPYFKVNEETNLRVSEDRMSVIARLYPAAGGSMVSLEEIQNDLTNQGYKAQLDKESVESFLKDRKYCTDFVVANGVPPEESEDGYVEYFFNTDLSVKPAQKEDGSVDFFNLKTVCECKEGDLLARLHPAKQGGFGIDVLGEHIQPRPVENVQLLFGKNVTINKERTELTANVSGHVRLTEGMVIVSDIYEVKDVDTSTGNIDYDGNLLINGNVHEGFTVKASGDIEVRGVVEGATVEAGGTVTVVRGINGNNVGRVTAGVNIISKYIENTSVEAGNYVQTEAIINSQVTAGSTITVEGKRGFITGGPIRARKSIKAKTIGSDMGTTTILEVGLDPKKKERIATLQKELQDIAKQLAQMQPILLSVKQKLAQGIKLPAAQAMNMKKLSDSYGELTKKSQADTKELMQLEEEMDLGTDSFIEVSDYAYPGTHLEVSGANLVIKTAYHYCKFVCEHGEVAMKPIF